MPRFSLGSRAVPAAVLVAILAGCSSDGGGGPEPGPDPGISITLGASAASVAQGGSTPVTATLTRTGGFTGTVNLTVEGVPTGVTGSVGNVQTSGSTTTATVTIQVGAATAPGTYPLTVRGTGSGVEDATAPFSLTVTAVTAGGFTLALTPPTLSIARSAAGNTNVAINRTGGFAGSVQLSVEGAPSGVTTAFNPTSTTGGTSVLAVNVGASVPTGSHTLTIKGTATGQPDRTTTLQLTVTGGGGGGGGSVSVNVSCFSPLWAAYQDGDGPWVQLTTTTQGAYTFDINGSRGGFAYVTAAGQTAQVAVILMSKAQMTASAINYCVGQPQTKFVNTSVAGLGEGDQASFGLGNAGASQSQNREFSIIGIASGPQDLIAFRHSRSVDQGLPGNPDRGLIRRDLDVANGSTVPVIDLAGSESFPAASATITVPNLAGGETLTHTVGYRSGPSCSFGSLYTFFGAAGTASSFTATGIPAAQQRPTDVHQMTVTAITGGANVTGTRAIQQNFPAMVDRTMSLPPALLPPTVTTLPAAYKRLQAVFEIPADYTIGTSFLYTSFNPLRSVVISAMKEWVGGSSATIAMPDFSATSGWDPSWAPATTATGSWSANVNGSNYSSANLCQADGRSIVADQRGTF